MESKYFLSREKNNKFDYSIKAFGYYLNHNYSAENIEVLNKDNKTLILIGDFIDAKNPYKILKDCAQELINSETLLDLLETSKKYAGRFLIFFGSHQKLEYVLTDLVTSIPVNYSFDNNNLYIASHATLIADYLEIKVSEESIRIKNSAEQQQPLPYNITMYHNIYSLIPNHFLNIKSKRMDRYFPYKSLEEISMEDAVKKTINYTKNILKGYFSTRKLSLPITAGLDSRLVLALMKDHIEDIEMYTFYFDNFSEKTADIRIPKEISKYTNIKHNILPTLSIPENDKIRIHNELSGLENNSILSNGYTYSQSTLAEYYSVPGEVITLTKSPFGKDLPESFATTNYFITKIHNYSPEAKKYIEKWIKDTKTYSEKFNVSLFDLFHLESRLGRWLPKSIQNYDYFMNQIYIFNSRYLIELWMSIPRDERTKKSLHIEIIKKEWPELLDFEINPDERIINKMFSNSYVFYIGSHAKYLLNKYKRRN